jgi:hypothetical protein
MTTPPAATAAAVATTSAAITTASAAASTAALGLWPRFVHDEVSPTEVLTVQRINCAIRVFVVAHLDESESTRLPGKSITNQIDARGCDTDLREPLVELIFR